MSTIEQNTVNPIHSVNDTTNVIDVADVTDTTNVIDVADVIDATDTTNVIDVTDVIDATDTNNVADVTDVTDVPFNNLRELSTATTQQPTKSHVVDNLHEPLTPHIDNPELSFDENDNTSSYVKYIKLAEAYYTKAKNMIEPYMSSFFKNDKYLLYLQHAAVIMFLFLVAFRYITSDTFSKLYLYNNVMHTVKNIDNVSKQTTQHKDNFVNNLWLSYSSVLTLFFACDIFVNAVDHALVYFLCELFKLATYYVIFTNKELLNKLSNILVMIYTNNKYIVNSAHTMGSNCATNTVANVNALVTQQNRDKLMSFVKSKTV